MRLSNQASQINTDYTEKQIKPQITRKESKRTMALRARFSRILARSAMICFLAFRDLWLNLLLRVICVDLAYWLAWDAARVLARQNTNIDGAMTLPIPSTKPRVPIT